MRIFDFIRTKREQKAEERNKTNDSLVEQLSVAINVANSYTLDKRSYVNVGLANQWRNINRSLHDMVNSKLVDSLKKASDHGTLIAKRAVFNDLYDTLPDRLRRHNEQVAEARLSEAYSIVGNVEGRKLDRQQMLAIIKEDRNHLIIAGAGTGKTTTVVGKIKYLLKAGKCSPKDILVLSFTNASASEMSERISRETGCAIAASTFHKLGLNIITEVNGIKPLITKIELRFFIKDALRDLMRNPKYVYDISSYLLFNRVQAKSEFDFTTAQEYGEYLKTNPPVTILNEHVKSYGELDIANFLLENNVNYTYEAPYKVDTRTSEYGQYYPDFYLPEYGIYIEYFGIDREGNVPGWFSGRNGMSPSEAYRTSMKWKRNLHRENGTTLVECYAFEKLEGTLLENLEKRLKMNGVSLVPKTPQELWSMATQDGNSVLDGVIELFETVINLIKSNNYTLEQFKEIAKREKGADRYLRFISLLEPIFNAYEAELKRKGEIDFNDMINTATELVRSGKYVNPFSQVIVDEYQDISKARFSLLAALRASKPYSLFCVGDDWQSIYRFAGSDIDYILNFEKYWGPTTISKIETTYRFTPSLIEISGSFITRNPAQIKKQIRGMSQDTRFSLGEISGYTDKYAVEFMAGKLEDLPKNSTVFFIGRYSFDVEIMKESGLFDLQYNNVSGFVDVRYAKRPDLKMSYLTAHKSKGLQADYVFIINNKSSRMGFPSKIQDDQILSLLLEKSETFPFAEERRLYYVALTRAKVKSYFLTVKDKESVFAQELHSRYEKQLRQEQFQCPLCGGRLQRRTGKYGDFFGCENYSKTGCKYTRNIKWKDEPKEK